MTHKMAKATGYPKQTVRLIVKEKASLCRAAFTSPAKWYKVDRTACLDDLDVESTRIWRLVHNFYYKKKYPTLDLLLLAVKEK